MSLPVTSSISAFRRRISSLPWSSWYFKLVPLGLAAGEDAEEVATDAFEGRLDGGPGDLGQVVPGQAQKGLASPGQRARASRPSSRPVSAWHSARAPLALSKASSSSLKTVGPFERHW